MNLNPFLLAAAVCAASSAHALDVAPPADMATGACTGVCGTTAAGGDITASPLGHAQYGYVSTAGSSAYGTSAVTPDPGGKGSGTETNGSRFVSAAFGAAAGDRLSMRFNYVSTDGNGYDDYAWARLVDAGSGSLVAWLFTAQSTNSGTKNIVPGQVVDKSLFDPDAVIVDYDAFSFNTRDASHPVDWAPLGASNGSCRDNDAKGCGFTGWLESRHTFAAAGSFRLELGVVNWGDEAYDSGLAFDHAGLVSSVPEPGALPLFGAGLLALTALRRRRVTSLRCPARP